MNFDSTLSKRLSSDCPGLSCQLAAAWVTRAATPWRSSQESAAAYSPSGRA